MAIIVSQSLASSHPIDHAPTKAVGVALPLVRGLNGFFNQSYTTAEAIRYDLINLLLTHKGERPMKPDFGSSLQRVLFQQNTPSQIQNEIDTAIRNAVSRYMPFVSITKVDVQKQISDSDIYNLKVLVTYFVPNIVGESDLAFLINQ